MEFNVQLPTDTTERRRLQNRIAQRRFRQKRRAVATDDSIHIDAVPSPGTASTGPLSQNNTQSSPPHHLNTGGNVASVPPPLSTIDDSRTDVLPSLDDLDFWGLALPSPSQFLQELDLASSNITQATPTDGSRVPPLTDGNGTDLSTPHSAVIRKPLRFRRSAQLDDTLEAAQQLGTDDDGWIGSLHIAARKGRDRMVEVLLEQEDADCDEKDSDGRTPLMHAVIEGHDAVARVLVAHGAHVGEVDRDARSALHWAALRRREDMLRMLLERRDSSVEGDHVDVDAYDDAGWTPLHTAIHQDFEAGVRMLLQAGATLASKAHKCPLARKLDA